MKALICASVLLVGALVGPAQATEKSIFTQISETAPRSGVFGDLENFGAAQCFCASLGHTAEPTIGAPATL